MEMKPAVDVVFDLDFISSLKGTNLELADKGISIIMQVPALAPDSGFT